MFLSGRLATFATLTLKLADQAAKGFKDNVNYYRKTEQGGALFIALKNTARDRVQARKLQEVSENDCKWCHRQLQPGVLRHGKYDSITQTTPFPGGYF